MWLSDALLGGALLSASRLSPGDWKRRLALAAAAGVVIALFHASMWPHCLTRLEGVSPEVEKLWLSRVREARPIYLHNWQVASLMVALPLTGLFGWALLVWRARIDRPLLRRTLAVAAPAFAATLLLLWQTRTGPAAQMMSVVGAISLLWFAAPFAWRRPVIGTIVIIPLAALSLGALVPNGIGWVPAKKQTARDIAIGRANRLCNSLWALRPVARQPKAWSSPSSTSGRGSYRHAS